MVELLRVKNRARDRYYSLSLSSVWELALLREATCLVVGCGALGNEVAKNLGMLGVRLVVLIDKDTVDIDNLTRSVFFRASDRNRPKVEVLADRLRDLNPDVEVLALQGDLEQVLGLGLLRRVDMVFSCLDNRLARYTLNRMCQKIGKCWVDGAMENLLGAVAVYLPDEGPCYECLLTSNDREIIAAHKSCKQVARTNIARGKVPTTPTMGSIIAALQVQEGIRLLHGEARGSLGGKILRVNCGLNDYYTTRGERRPDCGGHFRYGAVIEVPEWTVATTTPRQILARLEADTGQRGHLRFGRDLAITLRCLPCGREEHLGQPTSVLDEATARCPICGGLREPQTTNIIRGVEPYADLPLSQLGVPKLEILEGRTAGGARWYETSGDRDSLPAALRADGKPEAVGGVPTTNA
jgi:molybdopterin/thiamine biosynthesis adenylyltransferase